MSAKVAPYQDHLGTGRRKTAVARVRLRPGQGVITINSRPLKEYFTVESEQAAVLAPLNIADKAGGLDVLVAVHGGGRTSQAGAVKLGIARALLKLDSGTNDVLRQAGLLTRDGRMKERKKYGLRGARRGTQFSKR